MATPITREELLSAINAGGVTLVETLRLEHFEHGHLPGAIHIHFEDIREQAPSLLPNKHAPIITYCSNTACTNSERAANELTAMGYTNVRKYSAGKDDWIAANLPLETSAPPDRETQSAHRAERPEDVDYLLAQAFNDRDLERAVDLYEPGASVRRLAEQGGTIATGGQGIREAMGYYIGLEPHMEIVVHHVTRAGELALLRSQWVITGTDNAERPIRLAHHGTEVVRRQPDGSWRMVIDHPYGADPDWATEQLGRPD